MIIWRVLTTLAILITLLLIGILFIGTEKGTQLVWKTISEQYSDQISASGFKGRLSDKLQFDDLKISLDELEISIDKFEFEWQPADLLNLKLVPELHINLINVDSIKINDYSTKPPSDEPFELPDFQLPFPITIEKFLLTNAAYYSQKNTTTQTLDRITFSLDADQKAIQIDPFQIAMKTGDIEITTEISGIVETRDHYPLDFEIQWNVKLPDLPELTGAGKLSGDLQKLIISQSLISPEELSVNAKIKQPLTDLYWNAIVKADQFQIQKIKADLPAISFATGLEASGNLEQIKLIGDYLISSEEFGIWNGNIDLEQPTANEIKLNNLNIKSNEIEAFIDLNGEVQLTDIPQLNLNGHWQKLRWPLDGEPDIKTDQGTLQLSGSPENYKINLQTSINQADIGDVTLSLNGHGDDQKFIIDDFVSKLLSGQLKSKGQVNWGEAPMSFDLSGDWDNIVWQQTVENDTQSIKSPNGNFKVSGQPEDYFIKLQTAVDHPQIVVNDLIISGKGTSSDFDLSSLHADLLNGEIDLVGKVGWGEKIVWDFQLEGKNIDPGKLPGELENKWPGKLDISSAISGHKVGEQLSAIVENTSVNGDLRGYPVNALAELELINDLINIKTLKLLSGNSELKASGQAGEKFDLVWSLDSPDLKQIAPEADGQLNAQGTVKGSMTSPSVAATLKVGNIKLPDLQIGEVTSKINLDLSQDENKNLNDDQKFDIQIHSSRLTLGENNIDDIDLTTSGSLAAHTLKVSVEQDQNNLLFVTKGGLKNEVWSGVIEEISIKESKLGLWKLTSPEKLIASSQKVDLEKLCLTQKQASLCAGLHWNIDSGWNTNSELTQIPLTLLSAFMPEDMNLAGTVSSTLAASGVGSKNIRANLNLTTSKGSITLANADPENGNRFEYNPSSLEVVMDASKTEASLLFDLVQPTNSPIKASIETTSFDPANVDFKTLPLSGQVTTKIEDLGFIQVFTPEVEDLKGNLDVDLRLTGTVSKPVIKGHTKLAAEVFLPSAGIQLKDIKLDVTSPNNKTLALQAQMKSGEGQLDLSGTVGLDSLTSDSKTKSEFPVKLEIKGDRFELLNLPEAWVLMSPKINIISQNNNLDITGEVAIPEANLEPQQIASAVPVSKDVVIIDQQETPEEGSTGMSITTDIKVTLGDKISLASTGFSGALKGNLHIVSMPDKPITGTGEINIVDGQYSAYGQKLDIDGGKILFAGGPIDSPNLDLKAIRKAKSVTAGVHVTGPATEPVLTLFSKPSMNQDDILSYVMIGRPLSEATSGDSSLLVGAAQSLGFKGGEMLTENIGQQFGLDEFSIDGDSADDASVKLGKYLTPKLYISYGIGIFDSVAQLKLRYDLSKRWSIEADSGTNSGMDFLYKYEK
ncbi:MAG: translocation/assembly module TamB domain-containing protein [Gammaproteobacteria bacterium]